MVGERDAEKAAPTRDHYASLLRCIHEVRLQGTELGVNRTAAAVLTLTGQLAQMGSSPIGVVGQHTAGTTFARFRKHEQAGGFASPILLLADGKISFAKDLGYSTTQGLSDSNYHR
jgi:hypothetical protein